LDEQATVKDFLTVQNEGKRRVKRADALQPNIGLTVWTEKTIKQQDVIVAKNYLNVTDKKLKK
jgi:hypothetical protein